MLLCLRTQHRFSSAQFQRRGKFYTGIFYWIGFRSWLFIESAPDKTAKRVDHSLALALPLKVILDFFCSTRVTGNSELGREQQGVRHRQSKLETRQIKCKLKHTHAEREIEKKREGERENRLTCNLMRVFCSSLATLKVPSALCLNYFDWWSTKVALVVQTPKTFETIVQHIQSKISDQQ